MKITKGKGVKCTVEVTGVSVAMKQALECAAYMGRISLLGCTRVSNCNDKNFPLGTVFDWRD